MIPNERGGPVGTGHAPGYEQRGQRLLNPENNATAGNTQAAPCILGVDPGLSGAVAFLFPQHDRITVEDMPVVGGNIDGATLAARIRQMAPDIAVVEIASSRPKQGISSAFRFGRGYGTIIGVVSALTIPVHFVSPNRWKKHFRLSSDKEASRAKALQFWPSRSDLFSRKRDHGRAESALLARYASETILRSSP